MTDPTLDLDAIEARATEATPGPWRPIIYGESDFDGPGRYVSFGPDATCISDSTSMDSDEDAVFIAAARTDVPALVAEVRRLRAQRDAALALCDARQRYIDEDESDSLPVVGVQPEGN